MSAEKLPIIQHPDQAIINLQTNWKKTIDPVISNVLNQGSILNNVALVTGSNTINHKLGKKLTGWQLIGQNAPATIHDNQASNPSPQLTLILVSSAPTVVNLSVF